MKRYAQVIRLKPESLEAYRAHHAAVWSDALKALQAANYRNYSIFVHGTTLFGYFEYVGEKPEADQARLGAMPKVQAWVELMATMQEPLPDRQAGEWWTAMEEVFHLD